MRIGTLSSTVSGTLVSSVCVLTRPPTYWTRVSPPPSVPPSGATTCTLPPPRPHPAASARAAASTTCLSVFIAGSFRFPPLLRRARLGRAQVGEHGVELRV